MTGFPKLDVFLENSQTAFDPPPLPIFGNYIALFFAKVCKYALTCVNLQWNFLDWRWPPPLPPFWTFFPKFTTKIYRFETKKICNVIFWIGNDPPPSEVFQKNIQFGKSGHPLKAWLNLIQHWSEGSVAYWQLCVKKWKENGGTRCSGKGRFSWAETHWALIVVLTAQ